MIKLLFKIVLIQLFIIKVNGFKNQGKIKEVKGHLNMAPLILLTDQIVTFGR